MNYLDGKTVLIGDEVDLGGGMTGVVVCDFDARQNLADFPLDKWSGLHAGVLVNSQQAGVIHFDRPNVDLVLIKRYTSTRQ